MFIAHLSNGKTFTGKDGYWDDCPDQIASLHITLPVQVKTMTSDGSVIAMPPPTVELKNYEAYYFAHEAVAQIMTFGGGQVSRVGSGQGTEIAEVMAGIDYKHDLVVYIRVDKKANITVKRFPVKELKVRESALRKGVL